MNNCSCHVYGTEFAMLLELNLPCNFYWICHTISTESAMPFLLNLPCYFYWICHLIFYWICHVSCTEHAMLVVLNLHRVDFHVQSAHFSHTYCIVVQTMGNKLKRSRAATAQVTALWSNYHASWYSYQCKKTQKAKQERTITFTNHVWWTTFAMFSDIKDAFKTPCWYYQPTST